MRRSLGLAALVAEGKFDPHAVDVLPLDQAAADALTSGGGAGTALKFTPISPVLPRSASPTA